MIDLVYAHPYPDRSRANRVLYEAVRTLPFVQARNLYDLYPDFGIDVAAEQAALLEASVVVWQHPIYWYSAPPLLKLWFDKVLSRGWAYGEGGTALRGKRCQWAVTTGGDPDAYHPQGMHGFPFENFIYPFEQTARFCDMTFEEPFVVHAAHRISDEALQVEAQRYRERLERLELESGKRSA